MSGQPEWTERIVFPEVHITARGRNRCCWVRLGIDIEVAGVRAGPETSSAPVLLHVAVFAPPMEVESSFRECTTCLFWTSSKTEETGCGLVRFHLAICECEQEARHVAAALNHRVVAICVRIMVHEHARRGCLPSVVRKLNAAAGYVSGICPGSSGPVHEIAVCIVADHCRCEVVVLIGYTLDQCRLSVAVLVVPNRLALATARFLLGRWPTQRGVRCVGQFNTV